jgi:hypothetical protein
LSSIGKLQNVFQQGVDIVRKAFWQIRWNNSFILYLDVLLPPLFTKFSWCLVQPSILHISLKIKQINNLLTNYDYFIVQAVCR